MRAFPAAHRPSDACSKLTGLKPATGSSSAQPSAAAVVLTDSGLLDPVARRCRHHLRQSLSIRTGASSWSSEKADCSSTLPSQIEGLQLDHQPGLLLAPDAIAEAQVVLGRELDHVGVEAGDPVGCRSTRTRKTRESRFRLGLSRLGNKSGVSRLSVRATRASGRKVTTSSLRRKVERGAPVSDSMRSTCSSPSTGMPDAGARHGAGVRRHDQGARRNCAAAEACVHALQPFVDAALHRLALRLGADLRGARAGRLGGCGAEHAQRPRRQQARGPQALFSTCRCIP